MVAQAKGLLNIVFNNCCRNHSDIPWQDISELNLPNTTTIAFPNGKDDLMNFEVSIRPDEGYYQGGTFVFTFQVSPIYPHEAPKVNCKTKVYHPNIELEGNVCLNILREDWKPVLNINTVVYGLHHLFTEPNYEDPLNHDAAAVLRDTPKVFESNVRRAMSGGYVGADILYAVYLARSGQSKSLLRNIFNASEGPAAVNFGCMTTFLWFSGSPIERGVSPTTNP